jgi:hypothetical protein
MKKKKLDLDAPQEFKTAPILLENHKKPVTRRDFLAQGYYSMAGAIMLPSVLMMIEEIAFGLQCAPPATAGRMTPFLVFDLAGGASIAGSNVMVGKRGGQEDLLLNYASLGLPASMNPRNQGMINNELGLTFHNLSAMLAGIKTGLGANAATIMPNIEGALFCVSSNDDTGNNVHNPMYWITKGGARGEWTSLLGTSSSESGGNSRAPASSIMPSSRPVTITRPQDAAALVSSGKLATILTAQDAAKIMAATRSMSAARLAMFQAKDAPTQLKELIECGYVQGGELLNQGSNSDVAGDADVQATFNNLANADQGRVATISKLVIEGKAGAGTISKGGFDYHNGSRALGENSDRAVGELIGRSIALAARKQQDLMIYVFTDGSVSANGNVDSSAAGGGKLGWQGDSGERSATFTLLYKKDGKPELRTPGRRQVGAFNDAGANDKTASLISTNVEAGAKAIVANYLALHGMESQLASVVGDNPFGSQLEDYLIFKKIR